MRHMSEFISVLQPTRGQGAFRDSAVRCGSAMRRTDACARGTTTALQSPQGVAVPVLAAGQGLTQRVQAHGAQAERLGVEVLEAEGTSGPGLGFFPGLEPDSLAELVGRDLPGPAEVAV